MKPTTEYQPTLISPGWIFYPSEPPIFTSTQQHVTHVMVEVSVETTFRNPSRKRRREWQRATHIIRECKQRLVDGWADGSLPSSITTGDITNPLYSALQNQAIRSAKGDYDGDPIEYTGEQPIEVNNQNWEIHTTENDSVIIGFPCITGWWHTPIHVHGHIREPVHALLDGEAEKNETHRVA